MLAILLLFLLAATASGLAEIIVEKGVTFSLKTADIMVDTTLRLDQLEVREDSVVLNGTELAITASGGKASLVLKELDLERGVIRLEGDGKELTINIGWSLATPSVVIAQGKIQVLEIRQFADEQLELAVKGSDITLSVTDGGKGAPKSVTLGGAPLAKDTIPGWTYSQNRVIVSVSSGEETLVVVSWSGAPQATTTTTTQEETTPVATTTRETTTETAIATTPTATTTTTQVATTTPQATETATTTQATTTTPAAPQGGGGGLALFLIIGVVAAAAVGAAVLLLTRRRPASGSDEVIVLSGD